MIDQSQFLRALASLGNEAYVRAAGKCVRLTKTQDGSISSSGHPHVNTLEEFFWALYNDGAQVLAIHGIARFWTLAPQESTTGETVLSTS